MKNGRNTKRADDFIAPARRALRRAARKVREENRRLGLPVLQWQDGKVGGETRMITEDGYKIAGEEALAKGMARQAEECVKKGAEVYPKA